MNSLRDNMKDVIREHLDSSYCNDIWEDSACIADVVFEVLGITEKQQDLTNATIKVEDLDNLKKETPKY